MVQKSPIYPKCSTDFYLPQKFILFVDFRINHLNTTPSRLTLTQNIFGLQLWLSQTALPLGFNLLIENLETFFNSPQRRQSVTPSADWVLEKCGTKTTNLPQNAYQMSTSPIPLPPSRLIICVHFRLDHLKLPPPPYHLTWTSDFITSNYPPPFTLSTKLENIFWTSDLVT